MEDRRASRVLCLNVRPFADRAATGFLSVPEATELQLVDRPPSWSGSSAWPGYIGFVYNTLRPLLQTLEGLTRVPWRLRHPVDPSRVFSEANLLDFPMRQFSPAIADSTLEIHQGDVNQNQASNQADNQASNRADNQADNQANNQIPPALPENQQFLQSNSWGMPGTSLGMTGTLARPQTDREHRKMRREQKKNQNRARALAKAAAAEAAAGSVKVPRNAEAGDDCAVCGLPLGDQGDQEMGDQEIRELACGHRFHRECVTRHMRASLARAPYQRVGCPLCREEIINDEQLPTNAPFDRIVLNHNGERVIEEVSEQDGSEENTILSDENSNSGESSSEESNAESEENTILSENSEENPENSGANESSPPSEIDEGENPENSGANESSPPSEIVEGMGLLDDH
jgi:hypothetical protein